MVNKDDLIKEAEYYINNDVTVEQASKYLGISKKTLQLHMKKLEEIAPETYELYNTTKAIRIKSGNVKGGSNGKRTTVMTNEEIKNMANTMINQGLTYRQAEELFSTGKSTIHEMFNKDGVLDEETKRQLQLLSEANRHFLTVEEFASINGSDIKNRK